MSYINLFQFKCSVFSWAKLIESSRLPHFLDSLFTDGDEIVSLTRRPTFTSQDDPGTNFC
jgi:hypothetical protein